jgi:hypothetical protein
MALFPFGRKDPSASFSPEVQRIFEKIDRFLNDEAAQNNALPEDFRQVLARSPSCDHIPNAFGEFGRTASKGWGYNWIHRKSSAEGCEGHFQGIGLSEVLGQAKGSR